MKWWYDVTGVDRPQKTFFGPYNSEEEAEAARSSSEMNAESGETVSLAVYESSDNLVETSRKATMIVSTKNGDVVMYNSGE